MIFQKKLLSGAVSVAAILTLSACDGDALSITDADLAGDGANVNVSTNDDVDLVIGVIDDADTTTASSEPGSFQVPLPWCCKKLRPRTATLLL